LETSEIFYEHLTMKIKSKSSLNKNTSQNSIQRIIQLPCANKKTHKYLEHQ
jgi:hypothetical protein